MTGKTVFQHGIEASVFSVNGTAVHGAGVGATKFPHGVSTPFISVNGVPVAPGTLVGATKFPHGIDCSELTVAPLSLEEPAMKVSSPVTDSVTEPAPKAKVNRDNPDAGDFPPVKKGDSSGK